MASKPTKNLELQLTPEFSNPWAVAFGKQADENTAERAKALESNMLRLKSELPPGTPSLTSPTDFSTPEQSANDFQTRFARGIGAMPLAAGASLAAGLAGPAMLAAPSSVLGKATVGGLGAALGGLGGEDPYLSALSGLNPAIGAAQVINSMYRDEPLVPMREAEAGGGGKVGVLGSIAERLLHSGKAPFADVARAFENIRFPDASAEQMEALKAYIRSPASFKPQIYNSKASRAAVEYAIANGDITPKQAEGLDSTRQALRDLLSNPLDLPAPVYRGVNLKDQEIPRLMNIIGGKGGPASFTYDYDMAKAFAIPPLNTKSILLEGAPGRVKGIVVPKHIGQEGEAEILMHPNTNLIPEELTRLRGDEAGTSMYSGFFDHGLPPDTTAWCQGGSVPHFGGGGAVKGGLNLLKEALTGGLTRRAAETSVVKAPGGNWLNGSVEDALKGLKRDPRDGGIVQRAFEETNPGSTALNSWVDGPLTKYVKNDMATERDPVRALAERGVLHIDPERLPGFPRSDTLVSKSPLAQGWESASDRIPLEGTYSEHIPFNTIKDISHIKDGYLVDQLRQLGGDYAVAHPEAKAFQWNRGKGPDALGFDHLMDELSNSINPESGLPRHLLLDADKLSKVSMPQAVERVAKINEWRAAQKVAADQALANNAATVLHKEYPHSEAMPNPKGLKWVELKTPEGSSVRETLTGYERIDTEGNVVGKGLFSDVADSRLVDALKYEGDTMGHCVGGYCDDVASGASRIYSLRDAKGQPHVTIETEPSNMYPLSRDKMFEKFGDKGRQVWDEYVKAVHKTGTDIDPFLAKNYPELIDQINSGETPRILQIKGKQNGKPKDEYLPFVQDFVKSGQWSDVGDLKNSGLMKHPSGRFYTEDEANALANRHFTNSFGNKPDTAEPATAYYNRVKRYEPSQLSEADNAFIKDFDEGNFAQGGSVSPHGQRHGTGLPKNQGYFGQIPTEGSNFATEISADDESGEYPLMVPTLTADELRALISGARPSDEVYDKARSHADYRRSKGQDPFAQSNELHSPLPRGFAGGGSIQPNKITTPEQLRSIITAIRQGAQQHA